MTGNQQNEDRNYDYFIINYGYFRNFSTRIYFYVVCCIFGVMQIMSHYDEFYDEEYKQECIQCNKPAKITNNICKRCEFDNLCEENYEELKFNNQEA